MSIVAIGIGLYFLFSAMVVVSICIVSSRFSQQEGRVEDWTATDLAYNEARVPVKREIGKATRYA